MDEKMTHYQKWRLYAPLGLASVGLGLSFLGHSIGLKLTNQAFLPWFLWGKLSLITTNAGIALIAEAVKHRIHFELNERKSQN